MPHSTWADAFWEQAKQDFLAVQAIVAGREKEGVEMVAASLCMLLQMFFEKYAKAFYCRKNHDLLPKRNHRSVKLLLAHLKRANADDFGVKHVKQQQEIFKTIQLLEDLQPSNANSHSNPDTNPQLEYPWKPQTPYEVALPICSPAMDLNALAPLLSPKTNLLSKLIAFGGMLLKRFELLTM